MGNCQQMTRQSKKNFSSNISSFILNNYPASLKFAIILEITVFKGLEVKAKVE
jgi:hypothetical protein